MSTSEITIGLVFFVTLLATYLAAFIARYRSNQTEEKLGLVDHGLNKWLVGLSASTTGNSGFIVTGAVGLGYVGGVHWVLLPLSWLLGDLIYWWQFPAKLNALGRRARASTLSQLLTFELNGRYARALALVVSVLIVAFLSAYTSAQWLAGKKFLQSAFGVSDLSALLVFGTLIVVYSGIGGFRGSIYADLVQAVIRIVGTLIALITVAWISVSNGSSFQQNISGANAGFLELFPDYTFISTLGFISGYAFAAVGFGLGQPQIVSRYLAGRSPEETISARWIYITFIQFTWVSMTIFGVLLRGVIPDIRDPETGLIVFARHSLWPTAVGIIFADVFATIASTSNGLLVAISQTIKNDLYRAASVTLNQIILITGLFSILASFIIPGNVFSIAIGAVSMIGAAVAGPVIIKVFDWPHTALSLLMCLLSGLGAAIVWKLSGLSEFMNEAGAGIFLSLMVHYLFLIRRRYSLNPDPS